MNNIPSNVPPSSNNHAEETDKPPTASRSDTNKEFSLSKKTQHHPTKPDNSFPTPNQSKSDKKYLQSGMNSKDTPVQKKKDKDPQTADASLQDAKLEQVSSSSKENVNVGKTEGMQKVADVKVLHAIILKNVDAIRVGANSIQVDLKTTSNLPASLQGAQMTLNQTKEGLVIRLDNVSSVSEAQKLLTSNPAAAQVLADQLAAKGFTNAQFQVGDVTVPLPAPKGVEVASAGQQSFEREGGGQQGGGGQQQQGDQKGKK